MTANEAIGYIQSELKTESVCDRFEDAVMDIELAFFSGKVLVFRCTDSNTNWISNFFLTKKTVAYHNSGSPIRVHNGFYYDYVSSARRFVHEYIKSRDVKELTIIGHSLGGALATLCAVDVQYNFPSVSVSCITFGSPRVGNRYFSESYDRRVPDTRRYVYGNDFFCSVPMEFLGYRHVGKLCQLGSRKILPSFSDHLLSNYLQPQ